MINEDVYNRILNSLDENERENIKDINRNHDIKDESDQQNPLEKNTTTSTAYDILEKLENVASQLLAVTRKEENEESKSIQNFDEESDTDSEVSFPSDIATSNIHKDNLDESKN